MNNLGEMYEYGNGIGVEQNYSEAIKYYKMAIEKGEERAMYNLGYMYENGKGVERNYEEAIKYYELALEKGSNGAETTIGILIPKLGDLDNNVKYRCYKLLLQNEKTRKYAKKITIKCDIEEMSNLHDTIEELKNELRELKEHVKYMPNGEGYEEAKMEFERLSTQ
jgi:hypothetical protein